MSLSSVRKKHLAAKNLTEESFREICEDSKTMAEACRRAKMQYSTFIRYATALGCYTPNQSGKGTTKIKPRKYPIEAYLSNKVHYGSGNKLKHRLYKEGIKTSICEECGVGEWQGVKLVMHLHHKNGNRYDNRLDNLQTLCPNCHSQTDSYTGKNTGL